MILDAFHLLANTNKQGGDFMYGLLVRPAIGWGAWLLVHAIGIPFVYGVGKTCGMKKARGSESVEEIHGT